MEWVEVVDSLSLYPYTPVLHYVPGKWGVWLFVYMTDLDSVQKQRPRAPAKCLKFAPRGIQHSRSGKTKTAHQQLPVLKF